jgi:hypothetical protein
VIDGNNLAHIAYNLPDNQKIDAQIDRRLIDDLARWFTGHPLTLELCLDGSPEQVDLPQGMRIFIREHPGKADDEILGRFRLHRHHNRPCLVITNDEYLQHEVEDEGGQTLASYHFVHLPSTTRPVFTDLHDLQVALKSPVRKRQKPRPPEPERIPYPVSTLSTVQPVNPSRNKKQKPAPASRLDFPASRETGEPASLPEIAPVALPSPIQEPAPAEQHYRLTIQEWPLKRGLKFLQESFCQEHYPQDLLASVTPEDARSQDLVELASLLVQSCGSEPGFIQRGSIMDRIRLALLAAGEGGLTLNELDASLGKNAPGLRHILREKGKGWIACKI